MHSFATTCVFVATLLAGCSLPRARVPNKLATVGGIAVTNSPMFTSRSEPKVSLGRVEFVYSFIAEGLGPDIVSLDLAKAQVTAANVPGDVACSARGFAVGVLALKAAERWRVDCYVKLARETTDTLARADTDAILVVPMRQGERTKTLRFLYWLRIEDVS